MTTEQRQQIIEFINITTNEQHVYFLQCIADKISPWKINKEKKLIKGYKIKDPFTDINLNGLYIDIKLKNN